jgi:class 3 adenylate cyclase/pSer/pThr/pTyr-binding forkhead associated (FHA) protein
MSNDSNTVVNRLLELWRENPNHLRELESLRRSVAVLFTDIQGSTEYYEKFGDLAGYAMVHDCNSLLEKVVVEHSGRVVKNSGDAIMACFENCEQCVRTCVEMQQKLKELNSRKKESDWTRVRVGAHYGMGIVKSRDVFGDVVNVASRVQSLALPEQILISESVFREVTGRGFDILPLGRFRLKGKAEERELYEVRWNQAQAARTTRTHLAHTVMTAPAMPAVEEFKLQHLNQAGRVDAEQALFGEGLTIGRTRGDLKFPDDPSMSSPHAHIFVHHGQPTVEDLSRDGGVFIRLQGVFTLENREVILMGGQLFRFESKPEIISAATTLALTVPDISQALEEDVARLVRLNSEDSREPKSFPIVKEEVRFGRTIGDYVFPQDRFMSRTHARVYLRGEEYFLEDLKSLNGTFAKVRGKSPVSPGTPLRVGKEVFLVAMRPAAPIADTISQA